MKTWKIVVVALAVLGPAWGCSSDSGEDEETICIACESGEADMAGGADTGSGDAEDAGTADSGSSGTDAGGHDAGTDMDAMAALTASEPHEAEILYGWLAAGQPSETRVREIVEAGATIISLRLENEDPFDEEGLVAELGGTFIRYPTSGPDYDDAAFREAMYDLYDEQLDAGALVYLHCASSNRVGASWALYQAERKGVAPEDAIEMGKAAGLGSLEQRVRDLLGI